MAKKEGEKYESKYLFAKLHNRGGRLRKSKWHRKTIRHQCRDHRRKTALEKAEDKIKAALTSAVKWRIPWYGGNSTYENVDQLFATPCPSRRCSIRRWWRPRLRYRQSGWEKAGKPVFTFPTIGSNCSPVTAVCVIYKENGEMQGLFSLRNRRPMPLSTVRSSPKPRQVLMGRNRRCPLQRSNRHFQRGAIS